MDERHPDLSSDLLRSRFRCRVADSAAFDAIPGQLLAITPLQQPIHAVRDIFELSTDSRIGVDCGIDIERSDIASLDIVRVILRMIPPYSPANIVVPRHALPEI